MFCLPDSTDILSARRIQRSAAPRNSALSHINPMSDRVKHQASTYPIFFLLEVNNLMDWRRRKDILDSKMPSSFKTSSLFRPAEESLTDTLSAGFLSLIYRRETTQNTLTEFHLLNTGSDLKTPLAGELTFTCVTQTASKGHTHQHILQVILDWGIRNIIHTGYRQLCMF